MKTITVKLYTAEELKEQFPDAYKRAYARYQDRAGEDIPWMQETIDSLKTIIKDAGIRLTDWNLGPYNRNNHIDIEFPRDEAEEFTGRRAWAWLENNLFSKYRRPCNSRVDDWSKYTDPATGFFRKGYKLDEAARYYRTGEASGRTVHTRGFPGVLDSCPATGYCADDDYLDALRKSLRAGETLKQAFEGLADVCETLLEQEDEHNRSEEAFLENASANEWNYTEEGRRHD